MIKLALQASVFCLVLASCSMAQSGQYQEVDQDQIPLDLSSTETSAPTTTLVPEPATTVAGSPYAVVDLFFVKGSSLVKVPLEIGGVVNPQNVFDALVIGLPDPAHSKVFTLLPTKLSASTTVEGGVVNVNFKGNLLDALSPAEQKLAIAQIALTLTSQPGIGQATFSVNGKFIGVPRGKGDIATAGLPVAFDDYKMLIAK